ncbi:MAG: 3-deoxy-7-phosphoheptulonate synthase [Proteobacteria bacterium]|nr:3-deoxy-7-phosphoheptulonate synthase [Pseudomonadota bacterium]
MTPTQAAASTADTRIRNTRPLVSPWVLSDELPAAEEVTQQVASSRKTISNIIRGKDKRLLVIVGPCSIHDPEAALDYARGLKSLADELNEQLFIVLRVYFEKPRTVVGWKGLINDPDLNGSFNINRGLRLARKLLIDVAELGLPAASEFLDTTLGQYYADLISWGAIGARTVESQIHRELASGLSMPVGFKNRTDGDVKVAVDAINAAGNSHWFPSLTHEGAPAILETAGNPDTHLVLRGGDRSGPNHDADSIRAAAEKLEKSGLNASLMVDCSHANSSKDPTKQVAIAETIARDISKGNQQVFGLMLESHLREGRQNLEPGKPLTYGQSITDACLGFEQTGALLRQLADSLG